MSIAFIRYKARTVFIPVLITLIFGAGCTDANDTKSTYIKGQYEYWYNSAIDSVVFCIQKQKQLNQVEMINELSQIDTLTNWEWVWEGNLNSLRIIDTLNLSDTKFIQVVTNYSQTDRASRSWFILIDLKTSKPALLWGIPPERPKDIVYYNSGLLSEEQFKETFQNSNFILNRFNKLDFAKLILGDSCRQ